jgi:putative spermidine/putrescine transport system substrate-binding protein
MKRVLFKKMALVAAVAATTTVGVVSTAQANEKAICYNCGIEWADWGAQQRAIKEKLGIQLPPDNKNSGQSIAALIAEKKRPIADVVYLGGIASDAAKNADVLQPYKPAGWEKIPSDLKDPDGHWFSVHSGTMGFFVNTAALGSAPVPKSWADLLKPEYKGMVGYLDPTSAAVGQLGVMAVNLAMGGNYDNLDPAMKYFNELAKNDPIVPKQTSYARVVSGEIPILLDYDFNAYRAQYTDKAPVEFVIPQEGTVVMPYVIGLVKDAPNAKNGQKILDFVLSPESQEMWGNAFLRPVFAEYMNAESKAKFLPDSEYERATPIDLKKLAAAQEQIIQRYRKEVN